MKQKRSLFVAVVGVAIAVVFLTSCMREPPDAPALELTSTENPSDVAVTASDTPTGLPAVSTAASTPILSPSTPESSMRFEETFTDNHNNWYTNEPLVTIADGMYTLVLDCPTSSATPQCGNFIQIPFVFPTNFQIEMETTLTKASDGAGVMVGIQARRNDDGYYYLNYLITRGSYEMSRVTQTGAVSIVPEMQTDLIAPAVGETNIFGVRVDGAEFTPFVNGEAIPPIRDGNIRTAGDGFLVILVERGHTAQVQLDNLVVKRID